MCSLIKYVEMVLFSGIKKLGGRVSLDRLRGSCVFGVGVKERR